MKKNYSILLIIFSLFTISFNAQGTTHTVNVQDFSFAPATMEVTVGDTIMWMWISGVHTTTSLSVPTDADTWDANINSTSTSFSYHVTVAGSYNYDCTIHPTTMSGTFTATGTSGIPSVATTISSFLLNSTLVSNQLQITYKLEKASAVSILLLDMSGKQVNKLTSPLNEPGTYTETYSLGNVAKGEYILELRAKDITASRKIVVQ